MDIILQKWFGKGEKERQTEYSYVFHEQTAVWTHPPTHYEIMEFILIEIEIFYYTIVENCLNRKWPYVTVKAPLANSRVNWIHDPHPNQPPRVTPRQAVTKKNIGTVPRNNNHTVPRNTNTVSDSDARAQAPLGTIPSASWFNSSLPLSSSPTPRQSVCNLSPQE